MRTWAIVTAVAILFLAACRATQEPQSPPSEEERHKPKQNGELMKELTDHLEQQQKKRDKLGDDLKTVAGEMERIAALPGPQSQEKSSKLAELVANRYAVEKEIDEVEKDIQHTVQNIDILTETRRAEKVQEALKRMEDAIALARIEDKQDKVELALQSIEQKLIEFQKRAAGRRDEATSILAELEKELKDLSDLARSNDVRRAILLMEGELVQLSRLNSPDDYEAVWGDVILKVKYELEKYRRR